MKITFLKGENSGMTFEYSQTGVTIGREPDNVICLETGGVSRYHAIISNISGTWSISDLNSTNGIKVNGVKTPGSMLKNGDHITIGEHELCVSDLSDKPGSGEPEDVLSKFKAPLFTQSSGEDKKTAEKDENKGTGKRIFSNRLYYTIIACVAIMGITTAVKMFSNSPAGGNKSGAPDNEEQIELIIFEKTRYSDNNVFRFAMTLKGNDAVFTIDDVATERHSKPISFTNSTGAELLKSQVLNTGILKKKLDIQPGSRNSLTKVVIVSGRKSIEYRIDGEALPSEITDISNAVDDFAESCGMSTVSRTSEEILQIASEKFYSAEDKFANFEAKTENLRDAIAGYKIAVNYLSQFTPPPKMAAAAMKQLIKAEEIRKKMLNELKLEETRCLDSNQFEELRDVYRKVMLLSDPGSRNYDRTKSKLFKLDKILSRMGRKR